MQLCVLHAKKCVVKARTLGLLAWASVSVFERAREHVSVFMSCMFCCYLWKELNAVAALQKLSTTQLLWDPFLLHKHTTEPSGDSMRSHIIDRA